MVSILRNKTRTMKITCVDKMLDPPRDVDHDANFDCWTRFGNSNTNLLWELSVTFNSTRSNARDWISLTVQLMEKWKVVKFTFKIWMVTVTGAKILMNCDNGPMETDNTSVYSIVDFINKDGLFVNYDEYVPGNILTLEYEFDIIEVWPLHNKLMSKRDKIEREQRRESVIKKPSILKPHSFFFN